MNVQRPTSNVQRPTFAGRHDWLATFAKHRTLDAFRVPQSERDEVVAFIQSTKPEIVEA